MEQLPIFEALPRLLDALEAGRNAVLIAEPGAGKTTQTPLSLLGRRWLGDKKILLLEPRRLAARSAARYMADSLGEQTGETVGYRVRMDSRIGPHTRIEVVTEGILTRMLQADPSLAQVGAVLFDEFHERHLHGDLGLALALQAQSVLREDLRLVVMSATLDAEPVARLLGGADVIRAGGRQYPVDTIYMPARSDKSKEELAADTIAGALARHEGDVLAFLPGLAEIRRTARRLAAIGLPTGVAVAELHGSMTLEAQGRAIAACSPGRRKVVLATSIAESSLTVAGIRIVVDGGLMRVPRFSPRTGMSRLETLPVSVASADQRRGRAGRLAPGVCYRLWTETEHRYLPEQGEPEVAEADLASLALELAVWGVRDPLELDWLTPPPTAAHRQAVALLERLGALDGTGKPTPKGKLIASLGLHPRLGAMLAYAAHTPLLQMACRLAALLGGRDPLQGERNVDVALRLELLSAGTARWNSDDGQASQVEAEARLLRRIVEGTRPASADVLAKRDMSPHELYAPGVLLAQAYPDRIAQRRSDGRYLLSGGRGAYLAEGQPLSKYDYLVACELDDVGAEGKIRLAAAITLHELERLPGNASVQEEEVEWDARTQSVRGRSRLMLGALCLREKPVERIEPERAAAVMIEQIRRTGLGMLPLGKSAEALLQRLRFMALYGDGSGERWPDASEEALLATLEEWLLPHLYGIGNASGLQRLPMGELLGGLLSWPQKRELDDEAPTHWTVPSGSRIPIDYSDPAAPLLAVRLQELFGLRDTPRLAYGRVPLTLHLLSPARRPVQVTRDLESFWQTAYFEVKKDLKGRYPKHYWPDNPYEAEATSRVRPRTSK